MMKPASFGQFRRAGTESDLQRTFMRDGGLQAGAGLHNGKISQDIVSLGVFWSPALGYEATRIPRSDSCHTRNAEQSIASSNHSRSGVLRSRKIVTAWSWSRAYSRTCNSPYAL